MPKRDQLLSELQGEQNYGVLLLAQMDAVPDTIQLIVATTRYDDAAGGLRDQSRYVIRAVGVREHRVSVGIFGRMTFADDHPLLYPYNTPPAGLFFRGTPADPNAALIDLMQGYAGTFGPWHHIPDFINTSKPLIDLLSDGGDLIGEMPRPLADNLARALEHHGLETKIVEAQRENAPPATVLLLDDSYVVASAFSVDPLGKA
jgi:hypothetical protein